MSTSIHNEMPIVGYIIGTSETNAFQFISTTGLMPGLLEYIVLTQFPEQRDGATGFVDVLAQVTRLGVQSTILDDRLNYDETLSILTGKFTDRPRVILTAKIIGYLDTRGNVRRPRFAASPGHPVRRASDELLQRFFCHDIEHGIEVGHLIDRSRVPVLLNPNGLRRHLAIIAQTGAGKSYLAGRILESLIDLGATAIVLDPNSDYVQIRKIAEHANHSYAGATKTPFANRVDIYRIPGVTHYRYNDDLVGPSQPFTVRFADLDVEEVLDLASVDARAVRIRAAIGEAWRALRRQSENYEPRDLVRILRRLATTSETGERNEPSVVPLTEPTDEAGQERADEAIGSDEPDELPEMESIEDDLSETENHGTATPEDFRRAIVYIQPLVEYPVWGQRDINLERALAPRHATILDLAGGGQKVVEYTAAKLLNMIWRRAISGQLSQPVFVLLEEAHNLVPGRDRTTRASGIINKIASEGRKFKVFLIVVTQRPSKINEETLSQCGSQLIMQVTNPRDQQAVENAAEAVSADLLRDLPGLNRGEAVALGQLTRIPAMISIAGRLSAEGGADIDLIEALERARQTSEVRDRVNEATARDVPPPRRGRETA